MLSKRSWPHLLPEVFLLIASKESCSTVKNHSLKILHQKSFIKNHSLKNPSSKITRYGKRKESRSHHQGYFEKSETEFDLHFPFSRNSAWGLLFEVSSFSRSIDSVIHCPTNIKYSLIQWSIVQPTSSIQTCKSISCSCDSLLLLYFILYLCLNGNFSFAINNDITWAILGSFCLLSNQFSDYN